MSNDCNETLMMANVAAHFFYFVIILINSLSLKIGNSCRHKMLQAADCLQLVLLCIYYS